MLKSIYIKGFKSFCDPVIIDINSPVNIFLGPNGCGKSNIFDAFLWILTEQSIKRLRGDNAQDLIFNGTKNKKSSNFTEVILEIIAKDQESDLSIPITITRRIFRNDTSQFFINNKNVRLMDIRNKLSELHLNLSPFSFISQGNVETLLSKKPAELKDLFEEVAGIHRYKKIIHDHRQTLYQKQFEFNLLNEKKEQIITRLNILKEQSERAQKYQRIFSEKQKIYKESLILKYSLSYEKVMTYKSRKIHLDADHKEALDKYRLYEDKERDLIRDYDNIIQEIKQIDKDMSSKIKKNVELDSNQQIIAERIDLNQKELKRLEAELDQLNNQNEDLKFKLNTDEIKIRTMEEKSKKINIESKDTLNKYSSFNKIYEDFDSQVNEMEKKIKKLKKKESILEIDINIMEKEQIKYQSSIENSQENNKALRDKLKILENQRETALKENKENDKSIEALCAEMRNINKEIDLLQDQYEKLNQQLITLKEEQITNRSKYNTILSYINKEKNKGFSDKDLKNFQKNFNGLLGLFFEIFEIDKDYLRYIDTYMREYSKSLVFDNNDNMLSFLRAYRGIKEQSFSFISLEALSDFTGLPIKLRENQNIYYLPLEVKEDIILDSATPIINDELLIIKPFIVLNPHLMSKRSLIKDTWQINKISDAIKLNDSKEHRLSIDFKNINIKLSENKKIAKKYETNLLELKKRSSLINNEINGIETQIKQGSSDLNEIIIKEKLFEDRVLDTNKKIDRLFQEKQRLKDELNVNEAEFNIKKTELDSLSIKIISIKEEIQKINFSLKNIENEMDFYRKSIDSIKTNIANNISNIKNIEDRINNIDELLISLKEQKVFFYNEKILIQNKIKEIAREKKDRLKIRTGIEKELHFIKDIRKKSKDTLESIAQERHKVEIQLEKNKTALEIAKSEFLENDFQEEDLYDYDLKIDVNEAALQGYKNRIRNIDISLSELGDINPLAIKEYDKVNNTYNDYIREIQDIDIAIEELNSLINKANKEALDRYYDTIYNIEKNFKKIFNKLFNGGSAQIKLLEPEGSKEDLPVPVPDILISPPGKNINKINLLSGGEKALSALALIFSLFLHKPSPYCFLDEVDASLDEINTKRFIELVKDFSRDTQFFIITHNRQTMAIGNYVYGITSQEKGVSKVLSISFEE